MVIFLSKLLTFSFFWWILSIEFLIKLKKTLPNCSLSQLKRLGQAATGKTDKYGKLYNLEDEIGSLYGFRTINSDPERALTFMTTNLGNGLRDAFDVRN